MSASQRFLFRGFKILNFSLKVLIEIGSFMRVSNYHRARVLVADQKDMIFYRISQKKVPTYENSKRQEYFTDLNDSNSCLNH